MIINYKSDRYASHIILSVQAYSTRGVDISCRHAKALQHARAKQAVLLAAISTLAFLFPLYTAALSATSAAPAPRRAVIYLSPTKLSFASRPLGTTSAAQTISVTNLSGGILEITSLAITGNNASDFGQTNNCGGSVAAGRRCTISVTFTPTAGGNRSASVSIADNASSSPQTVALSGTGAPPAPAAATPSFSLASGTYASAQTVTISDATPGATIYYTTNGTTPTTASTKYTGAITVSSSETIEAIATASGYSTSAVATATYTISVPIASLSPTSLAFGSQPIDETSAAQTATLSNTGNAALSISTPALTGTNASDFAQTNTCGSSLATGASCTIEVTFTPSVAAAETATLSITDNASGSPQTVNLTGTGIPDVILSWSASPSSGVEGYNVYRGTTSGGESTTPLNSTPINGTTYVDAGVTAGATYYYYVTAVGSDGVQSAPSGETEATVPTS
jgi:hypothetical protein